VTNNGRRVPPLSRPLFGILPGASLSMNLTITIEAVSTI
jgi:hypothetical protein